MIESPEFQQLWDQRLRLETWYSCMVASALMAIAQLAARVHEANMSYLSLWYTAGRGYGLHEGEWKMTGGAEYADSILIASEPLTRDVASWVEVPEYSILHAEIRNGRPAVEIKYLD